VVLALTSFARSFKEAQAYLIPLMLLCLAPGMLALLPGLELGGPLAVVPLINIVLLARDVFDGVATAPIGTLVVVTTLLYALAAVTLAARIFGTEAVLAGEHSGWGDFLRRPTRPRPTATPTNVFFCLALLFPINFLLSTGLARLPGLDLQTRLTMTAVLNVVLFAGFPVVFAWFGRVQPITGFRLRVPGWQPCAVAVLLGLSCWPFVHELAVLLRQAGLTTLRQEHLERIRTVLEGWREVSSVVIMIVLAVLPAVLEELFFRGFLLAALLGEGDRPGRAVLASAACFAIFHLLVSDALAMERLLPSFLLGLALGWLAYVSGSVVPGMLLHVLHNGLIVLLGLYEPWLVEQGWISSAQEHLPPLLLGGSAVVLVLGVVWLLRLKARPTHEGVNP
jgi:ABC-2 type transport system permease protein/sodium transport system permease protein